MPMEGQICVPQCSACTNLTLCTNCQSGSCCDPNCNNCVPGGANTTGNVNCTSCLSGFTLNTTSNQCVTSSCVNSSLTCLTCNGNTCAGCITGEYVDPNANVCYTCGVASCATCTSYGVCTLCNQGFYVQATANTSSINSCVSCLITLFKCTACSDQNTCTACENGYFLNSTTNTCQQCTTPCTGCI